MTTTQRVIGPNQIKQPRIAVNYGSAINGISEIANIQQNATNSLIHALSSARNSEAKEYNQEANSVQNNTKTLLGILDSHIKQNNDFYTDVQKNHNNSINNIIGMNEKKDLIDYKLQAENKSKLDYLQSTLNLYKKNGISLNSGTTGSLFGSTGTSKTGKTLLGGIGSSTSSQRLNRQQRLDRQKIEQNIKDGLGAASYLNNLYGSKIIFSDKKINPLTGLPNVYVDDKALEKLKYNLTAIGVPTHDLMTVIDLGKDKNGNIITMKIPNTEAIKKASNALLLAKKGIFDFSRDIKNKNTGLGTLKGAKITYMGIDGSFKDFNIPRDNLVRILKNPTAYGDYAKNIYVRLAQRAYNNVPQDAKYNYFLPHNKIYDVAANTDINKRVTDELSNMEGILYDPKTGVPTFSKNGKTFNELPPKAQNKAILNRISLIYYLSHDSDKLQNLKYSHNMSFTYDTTYFDRWTSSLGLNYPNL